MKNYVKYPLIFIGSFAASFLVFFWALPALTRHIDRGELSNEDKFFNEIKTLDNYEINDAVFTLTKNVTKDNIETKEVYNIVTDLKLDASDVDNLKLAGAINIYYNVTYNNFISPIISFDFTYVDSSLYLNTDDIFFGKQNISFELKNFTDILNILPLDSITNYFDLNLIFGYLSDIEEVNPNGEDYLYKTFSLNIPDFQTEVIFRTDEDFKLTELFTRKGQEFKFEDGSTLSINASNIIKGEKVNITTPNPDDYINLDNLLLSTSNIFTSLNNEGIGLKGDLSVSFANINLINFNDISIDINKDYNAFINIKEGALGLEGNIRVYDNVGYIENSKEKITPESIDALINLIGTNNNDTYNNLFYDILSDYYLDNTYRFISDINLENNVFTLEINNGLRPNIISIEYNEENFINEINISNLNVKGMNLNANLLTKEFTDFSDDYSSFNKDEYQNTWLI